MDCATKILKTVSDCASLCTALSPVALDERMNAVRVYFIPNDLGRVFRLLDGLWSLLHANSPSRDDHSHDCRAHYWPVQEIIKVRHFLPLEYEELRRVIVHRLIKHDSIPVAKFPFSISRYYYFLNHNRGTCCWVCILVLSLAVAVLPW